MVKLSRNAESALLSAKDRAGSKVTGDPWAVDHLKVEGLVSADGNLTAKGHLERRKVARRREDEAFGG